MQTQSLIQTPTIEDVAIQFKSWRNSKAGRFDPIPLHLKTLLLQILPVYPKGKIMKTLNLS